MQLQAWIQRSRTGLREDLGLDPTRGPAGHGGTAEIVGEDPVLDLTSPRQPMSTLPSSRCRRSSVQRVGRRGTAQDLLRAHRLVTVTGTGGVGETRLAIKVANDLPRAVAGRNGLRRTDRRRGDRRRHPRRARLAALGRRRRSRHRTTPGPGTHARPRTVDPARARRGRTPRRRTRRTSSKTSFTAASDVTVLVTSRAPLHVPGEQLFVVSPIELPTGDSAERGALGSDRAVPRTPHRAPTGSPTETQIAAVEQLCRLVDGLPLGIELMAAQAARVPVASVLDHLQSGQQEVLQRCVVRMHEAATRASSWCSRPRCELLTASQRRPPRVAVGVPEGASTCSAQLAPSVEPAVIADFARLRQVGGVVSQPDHVRPASRRFRPARHDTGLRRAVARARQRPLERASGPDTPSCFEQLAQQSEATLGEPLAMRRLRREGQNLRPPRCAGSSPTIPGRSGPVCAGPGRTRRRVARPHRLGDAVRTTARGRRTRAEHIGERPCVDRSRDRLAAVPHRTPRSRHRTHGGRCGDVRPNRPPTRRLSCAHQSCPHGTPQHRRPGIGRRLVSPRPATPSAIRRVRFLRAVVLVEAAQAQILADRSDEHVDQMLDEADAILREFHDHQRRSHTSPWIGRSPPTPPTTWQPSVSSPARTCTRVASPAPACSPRSARRPLVCNTSTPSNTTGRSTACAVRSGWPTRTATCCKPPSRSAIAVDYTLTGRTEAATTIWTTARSWAPLWPLFSRRYAELLGPELTELLERGRAVRLGIDDIVPIDQVVHSVLDEASHAADD